MLSLLPLVYFSFRSRPHLDMKERERWVKNITSGSIESTEFSKLNTQNIGNHLQSSFIAFLIILILCMCVCVIREEESDQDLYVVDLHMEKTKGIS